MSDVHLPPLENHSALVEEVARWLKDPNYLPILPNNLGPLRKLALRAYANAKNKGFHSGVGKSVGEDIALMHSELSEALEEHRNGHLPHEIYTKPGDPMSKPEGIPIELADALIRIFDFAEKHGIDLDAAVELKMAFNQTRPFRHGGKAL